MLTELNDLQDSDESVRGAKLSVTIETRVSNDESNEIVEKEYTFSHAPEWDMWSFHEYRERRTPDTIEVSNREWRTAQHIFWQEVNEHRKIDVPPEVAEKLATATGANSVTIQVPYGSVRETKYKEFTYNEIK